MLQLPSRGWVGRQSDESFRAGALKRIFVKRMRAKIEGLCGVGIVLQEM